MQEGETLESIAQDYGTNPEELADANPAVGADGSSAVDRIVVPDSGEEPAEPEAGLEGGEPREAEGSPPGGAADVAAYFGVVPFEFFRALQGLPTVLHVEIVQLMTPISYDGLHCYVSLAGSEAFWVPDADHDPATDESFAEMGPGLWDVETHLAGARGPTVTWPANQPLPVSLECVGIAAGAEALDLGRVDIDIQPQLWDGTMHPASATGPDGSYTVVYRITPEGTPRGGYSIILDPDMAVPTNLRLNAARRELSWEYPGLSVEPIDGFRIYLNDNLLWTEPALRRRTTLPPEWFHPPCDVVYTYGVEAFRFEGGESCESPRAAVVLPTPEGACDRTVFVSFLSLETFDLGADGRHEGGDVGPPYGHFFANESMVTFDATRPDRGWGGLDEAPGSVAQLDLRPGYVGER